MASLTSDNGSPNPLVVSETPYILARLTGLDRKYFHDLAQNLLDVKNILDRVEVGQLHEFLSDCENYR